MRRRSGLAVSLTIACLVAGRFAALALADATPPGGTTGETALESNERPTIRLGPTRVQPEVSDRSFASVIVVRRGSNRPYLYDRARLRRVFGVATEQASYPTPPARFDHVDIGTPVVIVSA